MRLSLLEKVEAGFTEEVAFNMGLEGRVGLYQTEMEKAISGTQLSNVMLSAG